MPIQSHMFPTEAIAAGRQILDALMASAGFHFEAGDSGQGSGGRFATASYIRGDRRLSFSFRWALGCVEYRIGDSVLDHNDYMRLLGAYGGSEYCRFSRESPLAGFEAVRHDLDRFCSDFLHGDGADFQRLAAHFKANPEMFRGGKV